MKLAQKKAPVIKAETKAVKKIVDGLPFELTPSQKQSLWEVLQSLEKGQPMNRLLQGDVGSGKTIIVAIAALMAAQEGHQVAFMAPTEILARQHYETLTKVFPDFEDGVALLTSNEAKVFYGQGLEQETKKPSLVKDIESEKIKVVIGTHALIQKGVTFPNLSLIVVDEQHRFGVEQRAALIQDSEKKKGSCVPHFLSMSATPIPRTLSLTLFGDLDLSLITELPKNRKPIITKVVAPVNREKAYAFIRGQVKKGRQVFVICPRIEPSTEEAPTASLWSRLEVKSVKEEFEKLSEKVFPDLQVAMLHGKLKAKEKEEVMKDFGEGRCNILVSTSVVEVGVDVPNATIMMIEGAERFGLAQLYQFRGRVGRGEHQSFCFLFTGSSSKTTHQRLKSIVEAKNGLELAEQDLKIRGPGQFLGRAQTGMPDLAMKAIRNPELVKSARESAEVILASDKQLKKHPLLQGRLEFFQKQVHWE
jgi:ATP-dependent DNA helicase RecG